MLHRSFICLIVFICQLILASPGFSQEGQRILTLEDALRIAKEQSPEALTTKQEFRRSYWSYKTFKGTYLPQVAVGAVIPDVNRVIEPLTNYENGVVSYVPTQSSTLSADFIITQKIGFTGGDLSLHSGLERRDNFFFTDSSLTSYYSTPINITYRQPIFKFNPYKWDKKLEPIAYDQSKRKYLEDIEKINMKMVFLFFELLKAQVEMKIADSTLSIDHELYKIADGRYNFGQILENDLLNLKLQFLRTQTRVEDARLNLDQALDQFKSFLRIKDTIPVILIPPANIEFFMVDPLKAVEEANKNTSASLDFEKKLLEAARDVNKAKMEGRFDADLIATFGYNQTAGSVPDAYKSPADKEVVSLGFTVPVLDWGVARGGIKIAQSQEEIVINSVAQDKIDLERQVRLKAIKFNQQKTLVQIATESDRVAKKTYELTKARFLIGKAVDIRDLNQAKIDMDNSEKSYYEALQTFWQSYFELRQLTLYDFEKLERIQFNIEDINP
jgi:outer membrane protein